MLQTINDQGPAQPSDTNSGTMHQSAFGNQSQGPITSNGMCTNQLFAIGYSISKTRFHRHWSEQFEQCLGRLWVC